MTHEENNIAVSILSSLIVAGVFIFVTAIRHTAGYFDGADMLELWAQSVLWFILISIGVSITVHIVFTIVRAVATRGAKPDMLVDERDKTIRSTGVFIAMVCLGAGCMASVISLAIGWSGFAAFNVLLGFGALAD
ncbi:MAG: hypothetical protein ACI8YI_002856, partial [Paracoccaceae bacterium]